MEISSLPCASTCSSLFEGFHDLQSLEDLAVEEAFRAPLGKQKVPLSGIIGKSATTKWYSPGPKRVPVEFADLELSDEFHQSQ